MPRPTILTPDLAATVINHIRAGSYVETAAAAAGIHKDTFYTWLREGAKEQRRAEEGREHKPRNGKPIGEPEKERLAMCAEFAAGVEQALAESELADSAIIGRAARGVPNMVLGADGKTQVQDGWVIAPQWQAAAWRLERKHPKRWARTDKHEISGRDGEPVKVDQVLHVSEEALAQAAQRLLESGVPLPGDDG